MNLDPSAIVYGLFGLAVIAFVVVWNRLTSKRCRLTFDQAEKALVYIVLGAVVCFAAYQLLTK